MRKGDEMKKVPLHKQVIDDIVNEWEFNYISTQRRPVTVIIGDAEFRGQNYRGFGIAKCADHDDWIPEIGFEIAMKRIERQILRDIVKDFYMPGEEIR